MKRQGSEVWDPVLIIRRVKETTAELLVPTRTKLKIWVMTYMIPHTSVSNFWACTQIFFFFYCTEKWQMCSWNAILRRHTAWFMDSNDGTQHMNSEFLTLLEAWCIIYKKEAKETLESAWWFRDSVWIIQNLPRTFISFDACPLYFWSVCVYVVCIYIIYIHIYNVYI